MISEAMFADAMLQYLKSQEEQFCQHLRRRFPDEFDEDTILTVRAGDGDILVDVKNYAVQSEGTTCERTFSVHIKRL